jgi:hypothetical protein
MPCTSFRLLLIGVPGQGRLIEGGYGADGRVGIVVRWCGGENI